MMINTWIKDNTKYNWMGPKTESGSKQSAHLNFVKKSWIGLKKSWNYTQLKARGEQTPAMFWKLVGNGGNVAMFYEN